VRKGDLISTKDDIDFIELPSGTRPKKALFFISGAQMHVQKQVALRTLLFCRFFVSITGRF
jgi:hypothetical protein